MVYVVRPTSQHGIGDLNFLQDRVCSESIREERPHGVNKESYATNNSFPYDLDYSADSQMNSGEVTEHDIYFDMYCDFDRYTNYAPVVDQDCNV